MKKIFLNLRLGIKMLLAPFVVFIFLLLLGLGTYQAVSLQSKSIDDIYNNRFKGYQQSSHILLEMVAIQSRIYKTMNWIASDYDKQKVADYIKQTEAQIDANVSFTKKILDSSNLSPEEKKGYQIAYNNLIEFQTQIKSTMDVALQDPFAAGLLFGISEDKFVVLDKSLRDINALEDRLSKEKYLYSLDIVKVILSVLLIGLVIAVIVSLLVSFSVTKLILRPIKETIAVLKELANGDLTKTIDLEENDEIGELVQSVNEMSRKMNDAVGQALQVSGGLTDSAAATAASIEETSATLDEISSMTKQNAGNTAHANQLMISAKESISKANDSMAGLALSMAEITKASEQTQKIVKSIDEIAFQTNLLALNASVEAARAGEAGAGFAVVADEVRNLAMRAKASAQDSTNLLDNIVRKVKDGENIVNITSTAFSQVTSNAEKIGNLMEEIAVASKEQSQGIGQVTIVITEMSNTTQQNAGNADTLSSIMSRFKTVDEEEFGRGKEIVQKQRLRIE
jgi:methyl-accepting chemotaxis protein